MKQTLLLISLCLATPALHAANAFPDWIVQAAAAKTPLYPANTGAIVLLDDLLVSVGPDGRATERERRVVKILRPQGREYAQIVASYSKDRKLNSFHAWSVGPDGH